MKMVKRKLSSKILFVCLLSLMTFCFVSLNTFAKSNIDLEYDNPGSIYDYKFSNFMFSLSSLQFNEDNLIEIEFYDDNDVVRFDVSIEFFSQGRPTIFVDGEFLGEISNLDFNFINEVIFVIDYYSPDYDYLSIIDDGYFKFYYIDEEIYNLIQDNSSYLDVDFIIYEPSLVDRVLNVFVDVGSYLIFLFGSLVSVFYINGQFTLLGILSLCGLSIAIILLILKIIQNFLRFRG